MLPRGVIESQACLFAYVIVSTLLLFSVVFSLFFVSMLSKSRHNSYSALSSQTSFINSLNMISSDRFPEHLFCVLALIRMKGNNSPIRGVPDR